MFRRLDEDAHAPRVAQVRWVFDGHACLAHTGESVAAALLRQGAPFIRHHPVDGSPRLPYCMMGQCQECLVHVDEGPAQRACMLPVRDGLRVRPSGSPGSGDD